MTATLRAAVYGRESQAKARSIKRQLDLGIAAVEAQGWELVGTYSDGSSASRFGNGHRAGWDHLTADMTAGQLDVVVVWEPSRASRRIEEWGPLLDAARDGRVQVYLVGDDRLYDPRRASDRKALLTAAVDAEYESERLSERTKSGIDDAAKDGRPPMGRPPFGYRRVRTPERVETDRGMEMQIRATQEPDPKTAPTIASAFAQVVEGVSLRQIASQRGWKINTLTTRLRNPAYTGLRRHNGDTHEGDWPALVSPETFRDVQAVLDDNRSQGRRPATQRHLLSMIAVCGTCGAGLTVLHGRRYRCDYSGHVMVDKDALDYLVETVVVEALASDELYAHLRQADEVTDDAVQRARDELATLTTRLDDYRQRMRRGAMDPDDFAAIAAGLRSDIEAATERARVSGVPVALRRFIEPGADVEERWNAAELLACRAVIRALVTVIVQPIGRGSRVPVADRVDIEPKVKVR